MPYERPAWVEVDENAIAHNVRTLKALTPPRTRFMAVVKADGYGHGALTVARAALRAGADHLGVAPVDEALELRASGINVPLQVLAEPPAAAAGALVRDGVTVTLTTREMALALSRQAASIDTPVTCHLKVDTGMNRIGVKPEDAGEFAAWLKGLPGIRLEGVFTHFATADVPGDWDFARQVDRFRDALEDIRATGVRPSIVHAANSAATILHADTHHDMVRCGIAIYGLDASAATVGRVDLRPAMSVKTRVSYVKRIGLGDGVSYGLTWHASGPTTIATLPVGYADGIHRVLSNQMDVLIRGVRCRQVGRVCMDQMMVEIPGGMDVRAGDEAVVVGRQGSEHIAMDELAQRAGTINYEMACAFSLRMERRSLRA
ncbi:MAG TPA: alanine racemase [Coriobacteriia bacterium]|nr:alanine racemase [Coriobacteriia bacterium]